MSNVRRDFLSCPHRTGSETWTAIVGLLASNSSSAAHKELLSVTGIASQLISTESAKDFPVICAGSGDRVRIYCIYNDDALDADNAKEAPLTDNPTAKEWKVSIPAEEEDVNWANTEMSKFSNRITVRLKTNPFEGEEKSESASTALALDLGEFLKP